MYSNFAAGSTLSVQPGQRASCSTFSACLGASGVLLRIGGVQLLACFSTGLLPEAVQRRVAYFGCSQFGSALVQRDECGYSRPKRAAGASASSLSKLEVG